MSKIEVDKVDPQSGTTLTLGTSGDTVSIPSGVTLANAGTVTGLPASAINSGTLADARIPDLNASKITAGTIATARLGSGTASSSTFLRGDQTYAEAGGGGMDLLNVTTLGSAAAELIVDNVFTATYNVYKFYLYNLTTSAGGTVIFQLRYGGSSGTNEGSDAYVGRNIYAYQSGISQQRNSQNTGFYLYNGWSDAGSSADYQATAEMTLFEPFSTEKFPALYADGLLYNAGGGYNEVQNTMRGWFTSKARAKTGFRLYPSSGNLNEDTKILTFGMKLS